MLRDILPQKCSISRYVETLDEYNTPKNELTVIYSQIPCRISRNAGTNSVIEQEIPQAKTKYLEKIYLEPNLTINAGDIIECEGVKYRAGEPYKPYGRNQIHHIEIVLTREDEI